MKTLTLSIEDDSEAILKTVALLNQYSGEIQKGVEQYKMLNLNLRNHNYLLDRKIQTLETIFSSVKNALKLMDDKLKIIEQEHQIPSSKKVLSS